MWSMWLVTFTGQHGATLRVMAKAQSMGDALQMAKEIRPEYAESPFEIRNLGHVPDMLIGFEEEVI